MRRTSIRQRLLVLMICLATLPIITVTIIAAGNTRNSVEKEMISANKSRMLWVDQYLNELIKQMDILFYSLQINQQLVSSMEEDSQDIQTQRNTNNYIQETLNTAFFANSRKIDDLTLYNHRMQIAYITSFSNSGTRFSLDISSGNWSRLLSPPIKMYFKQAADGIYAYHGVYGFPEQDLVGGISVRLNTKVWTEVSNILKSEVYSYVFLINDEGEMLSGSTTIAESDEIKNELREIVRQQAYQEFHKTRENLYFMKRVGNGELTVVKIIPLKTVNQSAWSTVMAGIWIGFAFLLVSITLSILVSLRISRPITRLAKTMRTAHIDDFQVVQVQSSDEIGLLEHGYNAMMQRMKEMVDDEYRKNIELKNAQLIALQAQINPHFLNNTLQLIGGMALTKNAPEIYGITRAIGDLLRYAIRSDGDMVLLQDELNHMKNYLHIQENRFSGRCTVCISVDEEVLGCKFPKFILQPIVENAFEHGLQRKEGKWRVDIRIRQRGRLLWIAVRDNGAGMDEERLQHVRKELQKGVSSMTDRTGNEGKTVREGIGLRNVNARLRLRFGENYGARVFSRKGVGTIVVLRVPLQSGEDRKRV